VLFAHEAYLAMAASALGMAGATLYAWCWYRRFEQRTPRENHRILMRLSYASGVFFTFIFLALILWA
jgi:hypothetical protein